MTLMIDHDPWLSWPTCRTESASFEKWRRLITFPISRVLVYYILKSKSEIYTYHCGMPTKIYSYSFQWMQWILWTVAYWAWRSWIGRPRKCGLSRVWFVTSKLIDGEREIYLVTYLNVCLCQFQVCRNLCRCIHQLLMLHRNPGLEAWIQMTLTSYIVSHCYRSSPNVDL
jgi:hypothetical protein